MQFLFVLGIALGRTISEVLEMPAVEVSAWRAFYRISPFGDYRSDVGVGVIASTIANVNRRKGASPYSPDDFMPFNQKPVVTEDVIEQRINKFMKRYH